MSIEIVIFIFSWILHDLGFRIRPTGRHRQRRPAPRPGLHELTTKLETNSVELRQNYLNYSTAQHFTSFHEDKSQIMGNVRSWSCSLINWNHASCCQEGLGMLVAEYILKSLNICTYNCVPPSVCLSLYKWDHWSKKGETNRWVPRTILVFNI